MANRPASSKIDIMAQELEAPLRRYFARHGFGVNDIDDLVQEVFLRLSKLGSIHLIENTSAYSFQVAANVLKDRGRSQQIRPQVLDQPLSWEHEPLDLHDPERVLLGQEALSIVQRALTSLPPKARTVFLLHRFDGLNYKEIAKVMGISISGVEKHMMLALSRVLAASKAI
jgi:RNA polymerase sigma factor (sigma-70 family)